MKLLIRTRQDKIELFNPDLIRDTLIKETTASKKIAEVITEEVVDAIEDSNIDYLTTGIVRELANAKLTEFGLQKLHEKHTTLGVPVYDIEKLIYDGNKGENANVIHNPETVHKYAADQVFKPYALYHILPHDITDMHLRGDFHIHDLEYFAPRPLNCLQHDLSFFIQYGLKVDGTGDHTSVAKPPKHLETLMNHSGEIMLAAQQNMSGGQSMSLWNVFAAPFAVKRSYEEIKQCVQMFIFNLNMAYAARGSQVPFTSINLEFTVPKFLEDEPAYGPNGNIYGVYGDHEEQVRQIQRAFTETLLKGDAYGKPHLFPNTIYSLRDECLKPEFEEDIYLVHELAAKFGTAYFISQTPEWTGGHSNAMGCRTRLNTNWSEDWRKDTLRTGNLAYITLNLPRLVLGERHWEIEDKINHLIDKAIETLLLRREHAEKCLNDYNLMPFLKQDDYYSLDDATLSIGFVGLNEYLGNWGLSFAEKGSRKVGIKLIEGINNILQKKTNELEKEFRWTVLQSPAETTAHRFAMLDKKEFGDEAYAQGSPNSWYYTNSSHLPVNTELLLPQRIKAEEKFHPLTKGGHIFHIWMGESDPDPNALIGLTKKMAIKSQLGFWAYSSAFSLCLGCHQFMRGLQEQCSRCGKNNIEWYDRITGYVQQIGHAKTTSGGWNPGKKNELKDRVRIDY